MARVFGTKGLGGGSCNDTGASKILPTSSKNLESTERGFIPPQNQFFSSASMEDGLWTKEFYTKSEVSELLKRKADITSVYNKGEVDLFIQTLSSTLTAALSQYITEPEVDEKISDLFTTITQDITLYISNNYYNKSETYTKSEVDLFFTGLELGEEFVTKIPLTTEKNTISPGSNEAIPLTLMASSNPSITTVQRWADDQSNSLGRIRKSGQVEFYGNMVLGQAIGTSAVALNVSMRRIAALADPVNNFDAVNKNYVNRYILEVIDALRKGEETIYQIDCQLY
jgi:hypothetical protein